MSITTDNPMGTDGFSFVEYATPNPQLLDQQFRQLGFVPVAAHRHKSLTCYAQGDIKFIVNTHAGSHAEKFAKAHGPSACGMGFKVADAQYAYDRALKLGAKAFLGAELSLPAIEGIGGSVLYFVDDKREHNLFHHELHAHDSNLNQVTGAGLMLIDHLTHNVERGRMDHWADFYTKLFNFSQIRYFDIKGQQTGLISRAMGSPCGKIKIPLNESTDDKSQIEEFIDQFKGEGIQHIALSTEDIFNSVESLRERGISFMDVPDTYYEMIEDRLPAHGEDLARMHKNYILIDGNTRQSPKKILLQIFTNTMLGPVFYEIIQRKGDEGFG
ncbi:MAG: 4-hydroxyphenylpyruvate dioxygenase, partial [Gammaproteobacteria bacterium]